LLLPYASAMDAKHSRQAQVVLPCIFSRLHHHNTCAVKGAGSLRVKVPPGNCSLHPVAIGAAVKETKPSKPPV
jgi:hypothetical protein